MHTFHHIVAALGLVVCSSVAAPAIVPTTYPYGDTLNAGSSLIKGQGLIAQNGGYTLEMQQDNNLVLYSNWGSPSGSSKYATWATNTQSYTIDRATMQTDGNLVLYDNTETAKWSSQTYRNHNSAFKLTLGNDGSLIIYETTAIKYVNWG